MMNGMVDKRRLWGAVTPLSIIDVDVMTVASSSLYVALIGHWSSQLLCNCRVGMTYVGIVPSFITHSQLLATTQSLWAERSDAHCTMSIGRREKLASAQTSFTSAIALSSSETL